MNSVGDINANKQTVAERCDSPAAATGVRQHWAAVTKPNRHLGNHVWCPVNSTWYGTDCPSSEGYHGVVGRRVVSAAINRRNVNLLTPSNFAECGMTSTSEYEQQAQYFLANIYAKMASLPMPTKQALGWQSANMVMLQHSMNYTHLARDCWCPSYLSGYLPDGLVW